jgi:hypothetical protein
MYAKIKNENYGYSVATFGDYVAVGNPAIVRYNPESSSVYWSGSVDVFQYNYTIDAHEHVVTLYKDDVFHEILLAQEIAGAAIAALSTEFSGSPYTSNKDILIDKNAYTNMVEDGFGVSIDINDNILVVGTSYYLQRVETTSGFLSVTTGSSVDIFDLSRFKEDELNTNSVTESPAGIALGTGSYAGYIKIYTNSAPSGYDFVEVLVSENQPGPYNQVILKDIPPPEGGYIEYYFSLAMLPPVSGFFLLRFSRKKTSYVLTLNNPDLALTGSFGSAVSINDGWIAVGSPLLNNSDGAVYLYKNDSTENTISWSLQQKITINEFGLMFGASLELNKTEDPSSGSLIVGIGNISGSKAFLFEYISGSWTQTYTFLPDIPKEYPLTFNGYFPYFTQYSDSGSYGTAVSIYSHSVIIGAPSERYVTEYSTSLNYHQGAVYIYEKCTDVPDLLYDLVFKSYGNENTLKNNRLGESVGIHKTNALAGSPKTETSLSICYLETTLEQLHYCDSDLENTLVGQAMFIQKDTGSNNWEITNVYQRKKKFLRPHRLFGYAVDIADKSMVVGAPMILADPVSREINVSTTQSLGYTLEDLAGKAYIYNFNDFRNQFHVGNVFYRNGKVVLMTSGSDFDRLFFDPISPYTYEYMLDFKGEHLIYENQVVCAVSPGEFNVSTNPTAITKETSIWDINENGVFDFQDADVLLSYMQYKNTKLFGSTISTNWSSSIVTADDEKSWMAYLQYSSEAGYQSTYNGTHTSVLISESIQRFEFEDTWMQTELDLNQDSKIDTNDLYIMWKYFSNRLTQENYSSYINPSSKRKNFSDIIDYMDNTSQKKSIPLIRSEFFDYERLASTDKTGSYLAPFVTTIGLYHGLDLVAVAKLGSPIKIIPDLPINFIVKMDF